jgi:hypothetical protein
LLFALAIGAPALVTAAISYLPAKDSPCFSLGGSDYRLTVRDDADFTIKIDNAAARPDLVVQTVDDPDNADVVLVDDADNYDACTDARATRTIRIDRQARDADLTIALGNRAAAYKIYAQSKEFSAQDAAALFAVIWKTGNKRVLAQR